MLEEPTSLNALSLLPALIDIGIAAIKIEGRQRSPRYVADVVGVLRAAIDDAWRDPPALRCRARNRQATLGAPCRGRPGDPGRLRPSVALKPSAPHPS